MMMTSKRDFQISQHDKDHFEVSIRKPFLFFFSRWVVLTHIEDEKEVPVVFSAYSDTVEFISMICKD